MDLISVLFLACLATIAFCYAAVGHGGASGYIAVFALFGMVSPHMKSFVLVMNMTVASISFIQYYRKGFFKLNYFLPFGLGAAPMAYLGANFKLDTDSYHYILAAFLLFSVAYLLGAFGTFANKIKLEYSFWKAFFIALVLGFVSGITGVGGGIFLSPLLLIFAWLNVKETAAVSAIFIVLNSLAGLLALEHLSTIMSPDLGYKVVLVAAFGFLGSLWGAKIENTLLLKRMLAFVLFIAAIKLCLI